MSELMKSEKVGLTHVLKIIAMVVIAAVFLVGAVNSFDDRVDLLEYESNYLKNTVGEIREDIKYIRNKMDEED